MFTFAAVLGMFVVLLVLPLGVAPMFFTWDTGRSQQWPVVKTWTLIAAQVLVWGGAVAGVAWVGTTIPAM